jgi:hypothetical protein
MRVLGAWEVARAPRDDDEVANTSFVLASNDENTPKKSSINFL